MLEEAHELNRQGVDVVLALIETHGRIDTETLIDALEPVPLKRIEYRGAIFEELDAHAAIARPPAVAIVHEMAQTNMPGSKHHTPYEPVIDLVHTGTSVI